MMVLDWIKDALRTGEGMSLKEAQQLQASMGAPACSHCGECCRVAPCLLCYHLFGDQTECPLLVQHEGQWACAFAQEALEMGGPVADTARLILSLDCGCALRPKR